VRRRAVLFADGMDASAITQRIDIRGPHFSAERICRRAPTAERVIDNGIGSGRYESLGQWLTLCVSTVFGRRSADAAVGAHRCHSEIAILRTEPGDKCGVG
jgi:hypothetical protein